MRDPFDSRADDVRTLNGSTNRSGDDANSSFVPPPTESGKSLIIHSNRGIPHRSRCIKMEVTKSSSLLSMSL